MRVDKELGKIRKKFSTGNVVTGGRFPDDSLLIKMLPGYVHKLCAIFDASAARMVLINV